MIEPKKTWWKTALNKMQDVVADPYVVNTAKIANGVVTVAARLKEANIKGPLGVIGAGLGVLDVVQEVLEIEKPNNITLFINDSTNELIGYHSQLPNILIATGAIDFLDIKLFATNKETQLVGIEYKGEHFCWQQKAGSNEPARMVVWVTKGFDLTCITEAVWKSLAHPIVQLTDTGGKTTLVGHPYDTTRYLGSHDPAEFASRIDTYRRRGISRASLLDGPPGTGKTSFVRAYVRHIGGKLTIVPPDFLSGEGRYDVEGLITILQPDVLLFDDIDRAKGGLVFAITLVDTLRRRNPNMVVVSTVNQIQNTNAALLRPGRLGAHVDFLAPSHEERIELLSYYMDVYGVKRENFDLEALAARMVHQSFSHDYVRYIAEEAVVVGQEELLDVVEQCNRHLELIGDAIEPALRGKVYAPYVPSPDDTDDDGY